MTWKEFDNLKQQIAKDLEITPDNAKEKSMKIGDIILKILSVLSKEKLILQKLKADKDKVYGDLYHHYRFQYDFQLETKYEIESYVNADQKYYDMKIKVSAQECIVSYLDDTIKSINATISYSIKNFIDFEKLERGA